MSDIYSGQSLDEILGNKINSTASEKNEVKLNSESDESRVPIRDLFGEAQKELLIQKATNLQQNWASDLFFITTLLGK